jgi:hypothetical protein
MGLEFVYGVGALVLLTALIFGTLQYHYRNRRVSEAGGEIAQERYRKPDVIELGQSLMNRKSTRTAPVTRAGATRPYGAPP